MKKLLCVLALLSAIVSFAQVQVEVKDEQPNNQAMLGLRVRVVNNSGQAYNNVTVQYHLKKSASETFALDPYYTGNWSFSISEQSGENVVVSINIPHLPTGVAPDQSGYSVGIHRTDWQAMVKSTERGFPLGSTFAQALDYAVFQGNTLIGGNAYIDPNSVDPSLRFVGLQPTPYGDIPSWIEIENYGTTPANLSNISLEWATSTGTSSSSVSSAVLEPGKRLRICPTQLNCPDDDLVAAVPMLQDVQGEFLLRYNTKIMDYLSWGRNAGVFAADAREANVQYTRLRVDYPFHDEYWNQVINGIFYKKVDGKWYSYKIGEYDVNTTERPGPIPYINEEKLCLEGSALSRVVRFAWRPVEGAIGYNLTIRKSDGTVLFDQFTHHVHYDANLSAGVYEWSVRVVFWNDKYAVSNPWIDHYAIWKTKTIEACDDISDEHYLQVPQYGVHKDTRMLVPNWGELAEFPEISWDHPDVFVYNHFHDPWTILPNGYPNPLFLEVSSRCWAVATQILNAYYGGNLTQDEIKFYGKTVGFENVSTVFGTASRSKRDSIIGAFGLGWAGAGYLPEIKMLLKWALNIDDSQLEHGCFPGPMHPFCGAPFDENFVKEHINAGRPIYYMEENHFMIVDGYRYSSDEFQVHLVNLYNGGEADWFPNGSRAVRAYFVPKNVTHPRMSDYRVHIDSDGDGIVDFDESKRFDTDPFNKDSDGDGIEDKVEIFSYTIREPFVKTVQYESWGYTYTDDFYLGDCTDDEIGTIWRYEVVADIDGDNARAENDVDSDHPNNDGLPDGAEDLNHNGYVDNGETDPYKFSDDYTTDFNPVETVIWDAPSLVGIYAFEGINIGDNVTCNSGMHGFCQVASEFSAPYYSISVGANSTIGDVFSKGGVQLRDNAHVVGNASVYSLPMASISPNMYSNASVTGTTSVKNVGEWPYVVSDNLHHSLDGKENWLDLNVASGQTVTLSGNVSYRNLTVQPNATLKLGAGTVHVGNITLESGSKLEFVNPGRETVIIADGFLNWRAQILNSDLQTVAKGFKLIEYAPGYIHIEGDWAGTIHARWCELTLGQAKNTAYGSFVAKKVYLGNWLTIYRIHFSPIPLTDMV